MAVKHFPYLSSFCACIVSCKVLALHCHHCPLRQVWSIISLKLAYALRQLRKSSICRGVPGNLKFCSDMSLISGGSSLLRSCGGLTMLASSLPFRNVQAIWSWKDSLLPLWPHLQLKGGLCNLTRHWSSAPCIITCMALGSTVSEMGPGDKYNRAIGTCCT